jgi:hypothetical protein
MLRIYRGNEMNIEYQRAYIYDILVMNICHALWDSLILAELDYHRPRLNRNRR